MAQPTIDLGDLPLVLTPKQLGELLDKSLDALANDRHFKRGIPFTRIEKRIYYLRDDVIAYLLANRTETQGVVAEKNLDDSMARHPAGKQWQVR